MTTPKDHTLSLLERLERLLREFQSEVQTDRSGQRPATKHDLEQTEIRLTMKISELTGDLVAIKAQLAKIAAEQQKRSDDLSAKITQLEQTIKDNADGEVPADTASALADVQTAAQALDDTIPDAPATPAPAAA